METLSDLTNSFRLEVTDVSHVAEARREIDALVRYLELSVEEKSRLSIIVTEACTNLLKHGGGGELLLQPIRVTSDYWSNDSSIAIQNSVTPTFASLSPRLEPIYQASVVGLDILAIDKGKGFVDIRAAVGDGYSTAGSPGTGLGSMLRQSEELKIYSVPSKGSVVFSRIIFRNQESAYRSSQKLFGVAQLNVPLRSEEVSGDALSSRVIGNHLVVLSVDGLGHGFDAHTAAMGAVNAFQSSRSTIASQIMLDIHGAIRSTRGAAVAIAMLDVAREVLTYCSIGNITSTILSPNGVRKLMSYNGTVGQNIGRFQDLQYPCTRDSLLVMHSDGIGSHWSIEQYPGLLNEPASIIAAVLYRDYTRLRDDASIAVVSAHQNS